MEQDITVLTQLGCKWKASCLLVWSVSTTIWNKTEQASRAECFIDDPHLHDTCKDDPSLLMDWERVGLMTFSIKPSRWLFSRGNWQYMARRWWFRYFERIWFFSVYQHPVFRIQTWKAGSDVLRNTFNRFEYVDWLTKMFYT